MLSYEHCNQFSGSTTDTEFLMSCTTISVSKKSMFNEGIYPQHNAEFNVTYRIKNRRIDNQQHWDALS